MVMKQKILLITILIIGLPVAFLAPESRYVFLLLPLYVVISFGFEIYEWVKEKRKNLY
ncbi:hypothetical protein [Bacillus cihuensis]|uniref:hypothetical protein n=1 Tax=Bacillus cihuensis TaxID=1208599 RepID=UPI0003FD117B|nr:hypothetical protein [Bacillus cihuensis]